MKYLVVVEKGENRFSASVPDLPGCVATGETEFAALRNIQQAMRERLDAISAAGTPAPQAESFSVEMEMDMATAGAPQNEKLPVLRRFIAGLLGAQYASVAPAWDILYHHCHALPHHIANLLQDCEALLHPEDEEARFAIHSGLLGGKVGFLKCSLITFLNDFTNAQPFFEAVLPAREAFRDELADLDPEVDGLLQLRQIAALILEHTRRIEADEDDDPNAVAYYFFWLERAAARMLTHVSAFDMEKIFDEEEFGGLACDREDEDDDETCGCGHGHAHAHHPHAHDCDCGDDCECDGDCDCDDCECDCDCDCDDCDCDDCDCDHGHDDDPEEKPKP